MLQFIKVLQYVAVRCNVLQYVAVCVVVVIIKVGERNKSVRRCVAVYQRVVLCCSVLQCAAVCCSVLQRFAA